MEPPTEPLRLLLESARTPAALERTFALARARAEPAHLRRVLASLARDAAYREAHTWPTVSCADALLAALDAQLDESLRAAPEEQLAAHLGALLPHLAPEPSRLDAALSVALARLGPPRARAAAFLVDLLRAQPLGPARPLVYHRALREGVDLRAALAQDPHLAGSAQLELLCAFARARPHRAALEPGAWEPDARRALARALADWTRFCAHPRHLFFAFERRADTAGRAWLAGLSPAALGPALAHALGAHLAQEASSLAPYALGGGRYECARCGSERVHGEGSPLALRCGDCGASYEPEGAQP